MLTGLCAAVLLIAAGASRGQAETGLTADGATYTLALSGFSTDSGKTYVSQFHAPEGSTTAAGIYAAITYNVARLPEPASFALLGCGLMGVGLAKRRKAA